MWAAYAAPLTTHAASRHVKRASRDTAGLASAANTKPTPKYTTPTRIAALIHDLRIGASTILWLNVRVEARRKPKTQFLRIKTCVIVPNLSFAFIPVLFRETYLRASLA